MTSFWRHNDVVIASYAHWVGVNVLDVIAKSWRFVKSSLILRAYHSRKFSIRGHHQCQNSDLRLLALPKIKSRSWISNYIQVKLRDIIAVTHAIHSTAVYPVLKLLWLWITYPCPNPVELNRYSQLLGGWRFIGRKGGRWLFARGICYLSSLQRVISLLSVTIVQNFLTMFFFLFTQFRRWPPAHWRLVSNVAVIDTFLVPRVTEARNHFTGTTSRKSSRAYAASRVMRTASYAVTNAMLTMNNETTEIFPSYTLKNRH